jgi:hypothetical protein
VPSRYAGVVRLRCSRTPRDLQRRPVH